MISTQKTSIPEDSAALELVHVIFQQFSTIQNSSIQTMAYRPPSWRNKENLRRKEEDNSRNYLECIICTSQFEISCLNIEKETYDRFTPEEKKEWTCEHCLAKFIKWKPETSREPYNTVRPVRLGQRATSQPKLDHSTIYNDGETKTTLVGTKAQKPTTSKASYNTVPPPEWLNERTTSQPKLDNSIIHDDEETNTTLVGTKPQKSETARASYAVRPSVRPAQRTVNQLVLDNTAIQDADESNTVTTDVVTQQQKNIDTSDALLVEIRMLRGELQEINAKITSLSEYMDRKFVEFERRLIAKDDETLILRHSLLEHQSRVNSTVQPIKYFLFLMVLLYLVTLLHSKRN